MTCVDCSKPLQVIRYRFGEARTCFLCAIARMRRGERCHA
jgi:hypothetical protein